MNFSVVIVSLNGEKRLPACLDALRATIRQYVSARPGAKAEIIVVDNGSADATGGAVRRAAPEATVLRAESNLGFAGGNNLGIERATGDAVILLNDDTYPQAGWLEALADAAESLPDWGALGCLLLYPQSRKVQHAGGIIRANGLTDHFGWGESEERWRAEAPFACDYVTGAAMAIRREALDLCGTLDADFFPIYFEETDYCVRLERSGFGVYMVPSSLVLHDESQVTQVRSAGFYQKYHRHRYRFLLKTRTASELWATLKAELAWLRNRHHWNHVPFVWRALWRNALALFATRRARRQHFRVVREARSALAARPLWPAGLVRPPRREPPPQGGPPAGS